MKILIFFRNTGISNTEIQQWYVQLPSKKLATWVKLSSAWPLRTLANMRSLWCNYFENSYFFPSIAYVKKWKWKITDFFGKNAYFTYGGQFCPTHKNFKELPVDVLDVTLTKICYWWYHGNKFCKGYHKGQWFSNFFEH